MKLEKVIVYLSEFNSKIGKTLFILGFDSTKKGYLIVQDYYGLLSVAKRNLKDGCTPTITSAINKEDYFRNKLISKNISYRKGMFEILKIDKRKVLCKDKYGLMLVDSGDLLKGNTCGIKSALNKTEYFNKKLLDTNIHFKNGDFIVLGDYVGRDYGSMVIDTKCCGIQKVRSDALLTYKPGSYTKINKIQENKLKKYFYVIRLYDENESFYKIGVTNRIKGRLSEYSSVYKTELIHLDNKCMYPEFAYTTEQKILAEFKRYRYTPLKYFSGYTECLTIDPLPFIYN